AGAKHRTDAWYSQLSPTSADREAVQAMATQATNGVNDGVSGIAKGIGNFPAVTLNSITDVAFNTRGGVYLPGPNPFAIPLPFSAGNAREESYMSAGTTGFGLGLGSVGGVFAGGSSLSVVPEELTTLSTTEQLQFHVTRAAQEVDAAGDTAFTAGQQRALANNPGLRPAFRGNRIDVMARRFVSEDPNLSFLKSNYNRGPDFVHPRTGQWWDMTTPRQWQTHVNRYGQNGTLLSTQ
ncbi:MAG: hypothetical protein ABI999_08295, partial [Acidobacteriota bacterium]